MEDFIRLLKTLSEARGPSGFEDEVREVVIKEMEPYVDEVVVDRWGNVIGVKRGSSNYRAMVAAHMDEIGLVVDYIDKEGFLRIRPIGGWSEVTLAGQRVWVRAADGRWARGVVGVTPPHVTPSGKEREAPEIKDMYVDVGARSREEVERMGIAVGSVAVLERELAVLNGGVVTGKAFDDRVGVAVMLYALRQLKEVPVTLYAPFQLRPDEESTRAQEAQRPPKPGPRPDAHQAERGLPLGPTQTHPSRRKTQLFKHTQGISTAAVADLEPTRRGEANMEPKAREIKNKLN